MRSIFFIFSALIFQIFNLKCGLVASYNILVSTVGIAASQNLVMYRLADLLAERGHRVTVLKVDVFQEAKTPKLRFVQEQISYTVFPDSQIREELRLGEQNLAWNTTQAFANVTVIRQFFGHLSNSCRNFLADENSETFRKLKNGNFDVYVLHMIDFCSFGLAHKFNVTGTIWMSTAFSLDFMSWYAGAPTPVSYVPAGPNPMPAGAGFWDRLWNALNFLMINTVFQYGVVRTYTQIFREKFGPDFPTFGQLLHKTQLHFINSDPFFEYPRPILHKMIYVGGLTMENPQPLNQKWQKIVDSAENGIVVFSLGTVANTTYMPLDWKMSFIEAFKKIKQTVIWRLEGDTSVAEGVPNIVVADWIPQRDLLANPKVKAAIIHGGYNSLTEATYMGVPLIMMPLFGDQYSNCKRVERLNVGVILNRKNITAESIYEALDTVINNQTIQNNAKRLGRMIRKKPHSSKQAAVEWVEFLAEFKDLSQLSPKGQQLNLIEYFMIDVLICVILFILTLTLVFVWICYKLVRTKCFRKSEKRKTE